MRDYVAPALSTVGAAVGLVLWYRAPAGSPNEELRLLGVWLTWVLVCVFLSATLASRVTFRGVHGSRWLHLLPPVDRRLGLAALIVAPTVIVIGAVVAMLV